MSFLAPFRSHVLGAATALLVAAPLAAAADEPQPAKPKVVEFKVGGSFQEDPSPEQPFGPTRRNFRGKMLLLRQIAADPAIAGIRLEVDSAPDFARTLDLVRELEAVKAAGKKIVCYAEGLDQRALMFASLADELVVPPSGMVILEGLGAEVMYLADLLALADAKVEVVHIGEYKTAYENLSRPTMSEQQREVIGHLLDEFYGQMLDMIARNRGIERQALDALYDELLIEPERAAEAKLITAVGYEDEFDARCRKLFGGEFELDEDYGDSAKEDLEKMLASPFAVFQMLPKLLNPPKKKLPDEPRIAIVYASGPISSGKSKAGLDGQVSQMGSDTIVEALEKARDDDFVKAVVLRVNSPGGSATASDMIWRAVQRVREKKPVVASMGGVAGSGGYWISMGCDRIVAQPSTITGSIGVVGMLPNLSQTLKRVGINVEFVGRGPHAADLAMLRDGPSQTLKESIRRMMVGVYGEFVRKVAEGRHMKPEMVEPIARGRVWTGRQALELNLVDRLGGLEDAIALACELGGGLDPATVGVAEYPEAPNFMEAIEQAFDEMATVQGRVRVLADALGYGELVGMADVLLGNVHGIDPSCVQAVVPFALTVR